MSKKVILTGGAGFIGSHVCDRLLADGYEVVCVDNLGSGRKSNIEHLLNNSNFTFLELDLTDQAVYDRLPTQFDVLMHLASPASPAYYMIRKIETLMVNSFATHWLLQKAKDANARFLFTSTSEIYGDPMEHPQKESYRGNVDPVGEKCHYKEAKRFGESVCMTHVREFKTDVCIVRIFNTYGPRNRPDDGRVIPNLINQALEGRELTVYGDGGQTRSLCYVSDLVNGLMKVIETEDITGEVFNLGNPTEMTILEIAQVVKELIPTAGEIVHKPLPAEDPHRRKPDITKATTRLGWEPTVGLETGLRATIAYYQNEELHAKS